MVTGELIDPLPLRHVARERPKSRLGERAFDRSRKAPDIVARLEKPFGEEATNARSCARNQNPHLASPVGGALIAKGILEKPKR